MLCDRHIGRCLVLSFERSPEAAAAPLFCDTTSSAARARVRSVVIHRKQFPHRISQVAEVEQLGTVFTFPRPAYSVSCPAQAEPVAVADRVVGHVTNPRSRRPIPRAASSLTTPLLLLRPFSPSIPIPIATSTPYESQQLRPIPLYISTLFPLVDHT